MKLNTKFQITNSKKGQNSKYDKVSQDELIIRLNRIAGQVKGVSTMIEEEKDCLAIMHQIMAARSGLSKVASKMLTKESCRINFSKKPKEFESLLNQLINLQ
jgi:DNA-binding FrmR family transcriptional regulator